jgi:hypothetical protein
MTSVGESSLLHLAQPLWVSLLTTSALPLSGQSKPCIAVWPDGSSMPGGPAALPLKRDCVVLRER